MEISDINYTLGSEYTETGDEMLRVCLNLLSAQHHYLLLWLFLEIDESTVPPAASENRPV